MSSPHAVPPADLADALGQDDDRVRPSSPQRAITTARRGLASSERRPRQTRELYLQPRWPPPDPRRRPLARNRSLLHGCMAVLLLGQVLDHVQAAMIPFDNCLDPNVINSHPVQLQFTPLFFSATFDTTNSSHHLNVTIYGNVSGSATVIVPPPASDPQWSDPNKTLGKIVDLSEPNNKFATLFAKVNVLSYTPYEMNPARFCGDLVHGECPLGPAFDANASDPAQLPAFSVAHDMNSSYAFTTLSSTLHVTSGDVDNAVLACVSANITPDLGRSLSGLLAFIPLIILVIVGFGTAFAAIYSPWGSSDVFRWTSNYGRDADLLRLVTPGFGDCLQYIQFVVLTGGLSLNYPGYYQPAASQASWSILTFNNSFVSHGNGTQSLVDGMYVTQGDYGLDQLSQLVGLTSVKDIWAGFVVWLLVIIAAVIALIQAGFVFRWLYRHVSGTPEEDLRAKNLPFTLGNVIRIVFNYFLLPSVALSMFQLVIAGDDPIAPATTAFAVVLLLALIGFSVWLLRLIAKIRPRSYLFDDLATVLQYGPLYNTYSDNAAAFALVPLFLQFLRGIAIGAIQQSGIAQIIVLAICEVILILTLHAFRPFQSTTSNNAYHTFFAVVRLLTTLLMVAFVPSLGVTESPKGWIGYVILLMHAIALVFGFFLNAVQTIVEVGARLAGAGGDDGVGGGVARGGLTKVFGMRQLSRRMPRRPGGRESGISDGDILATETDRKSPLNGSRARSASGSSALLLARNGASEGRASAGLESVDAAGQTRRGSGSGYTPTTPGGQSTFSYVPSHQAGSGSAQGGLVGLRNVESADPYYRPPRRKATMTTTESPTSVPKRGSWASGDWANQRWSQSSTGKNVPTDPLDGPSISGRGTPVPAFLASRDIADPNTSDPRRPQTDYAVREVDFYYGVRGPALSNLPTRRLGTGPADPTGTVASAAGWFKGFFGGKTKEKGKGFEVVRSSRAPAPMVARAADGSTLPGEEGLAMEDGTPRQLMGVLPAERARQARVGAGGEEDEDEEDSGDSGEDPDGSRRISDVPPSLPGIDTGGAIELPSRVGSKVSSRVNSRTNPKVPRNHLKRASTGPTDAPILANRLSAIHASPPSTPRLYDPHPPRLPSSQPPFGSGRPTDESIRTSAGAESIESSLIPSLDDNDIAASGSTHARHSSSVFGGLTVDRLGDPRASMGYVQQHRASDHVHDAVQQPHEGVDYLGSAAELVDGSTRSNDGSYQGSHQESHRGSQRGSHHS
ncbi:MAG: hypothetical protein M1838_004699 [Thelocarpon superellum]|nr:MAG: hypothetical protein M1838_004699 [Thelocarpon superellum]